MAHSWDSGSRPLRVLAAGAFALAALDAHALALGDAEVRSVLGENLDLRIPVTIGGGESIEPSCFKLATEPAASVPRVTSGRVSLERSLLATYLRVRTDTAMSEPAIVLGIVASCSGESARAHRDYALLFDPRAAAPLGAGTGTRADSQEPARWTLPSIATLIARLGDTLESIANAIFPANRAAKESYIQALRDTNPPLAALHERDPIPVDTPIALPDLRTFARARPHAETRMAAAPITSASEAKPPTAAPAPGAPAPARKSKVARPAVEHPARAATEVARRPVSEPAAKARDVAPAAKRPASVRAPGFMLKLSSGEMDLSPSKTVDDRMRAQLRERQLLLDADDQVAAVLSLRHSVRQLETRVAELQLKLAGMPSSFPAPKTAEVAAPAPAVSAPAPAVSAPAPAVSAPAPAVSTPAPAVSAPALPAPAPAPPAPVATQPAAAEPPAPGASPQAATTPARETEVAATAAKPAEKVEPPPVPAPAPSPAPLKTAQSAPEIDWLYYGLWALAFLLVAAAIFLAMRLAKRNREAAYEFADETSSETPAETPDETLDETPAEPLAEDEIVVAFEPPPAEETFAAEPPQRMLDADVDIETRLPDNSADDLRRRYIEERFPEIQKGAISLADPNSVVKGARLFYEDGAIARAVELLHFAIERHPEHVKAWLALFEIFRLEGLKGEFVELARRFREEHGKSDYWRKIQYFGREIDPGNELYAEKPLNTFETIGPAQARRFSEEGSFDPVAENWLGAPMDFQNEVLANELRMALMAGAGIGESDLVPNPMPALRNVEMFNVA